MFVCLSFTIVLAGFLARRYKTEVEDLVFTRPYSLSLRLCFFLNMDLTPKDTRKMKLGQGRVCFCTTPLASIHMLKFVFSCVNTENNGNTCICE